MINLLFDFDGTLFESSSGIYSSFQFTCSELNLIPPDFSEFVCTIGPPVGRIVDHFYPLSLLSRSRFIDLFRAHYDSFGYKESNPYDGIIRVLILLISHPVTLDLLLLLINLLLLRHLCSLCIIYTNSLIT